METELQILRNELHGDERDFESLEQEISQLHLALTHAERDIGNTKEQMRTLERSSKWHSETAHESEMSVRELKDVILRKHHDEVALDHQAMEAKHVYEEKNRERVGLHEEVRHLEQELQIKARQVNVGSTLAHSGGGDLVQLESNVNRLEGEQHRSKTDLQNKEREALQLKRKIERLKTEERVAVNELQQMM